MGERNRGFSHIAEDMLDAAYAEKLLLPWDTGCCTALNDSLLEAAIAAGYIADDKREIKPLFLYLLTKIGERDSATEAVDSLDFAIKMGQKKVDTETGKVRHLTDEEWHEHHSF